MSRWTAYKLWLIKRLLWRADAVICSLPVPEAPKGEYFGLWGDLGNVHRAVDRAYGGCSMTQKQAVSRVLRSCGHIDGPGAGLTDPSLSSSHPTSSREKQP